MNNYRLPRYLKVLTMNSTVPILAVCRTPVTYELTYMTLLSMSSRSSVERAPTRCLGGHGFDSCRGLRFFLCFHARVMADQFNFYIDIIGLFISARKKKFN